MRQVRTINPTPEPGIAPDDQTRRATPIIPNSTGVGLAIKRNQHLSIDELSTGLAKEIDTIGRRFGTELKLARMGTDKAGVDSTTKAVLKSSGGRRLAVVICSRPASPEQAIRGVRRADEVRHVVGNLLGNAIIQPLLTSYIGGRSVVFLPWGRDLPHSKLGSMWARSRLRRPILNWLYESVASSVQFHREARESNSGFGEALEHLLRQTFLTKNMRTSASVSLKRLESGAWRPSHCIDHNDFWYGNFLIPDSSVDADSSPYPFILIDWAGANAKGYGVYDLLRFAQSFRVPRRTLCAELRRHAAAMDCAVSDLRGRFLACISHLHQNLEHFPLERYKTTVGSCWHLLSELGPTAEEVRS